MTTEQTLSEGSKKLQTHPLSDTDKQILQLLQEDYPLSEKPWKELSNKLGIPENQLITRIQKMFAAGVIKKIGPVLDPVKVGYTAATLVALRVPEDKIDTIAAVINQYSNISHNYERDHEYNVWFTLVAKSQQELSHILKEILQKNSLNESDVLNLPTAQRFKINVNFQITKS
jgi:DNA-binding Lrp family transcriptional regulator